MQYLGFIVEENHKNWKVLYLVRRLTQKGKGRIYFSDVHCSALAAVKTVIQWMQVRPGILHFYNVPGAMYGVLLCNPFSEQS